MEIWKDIPSVKGLYQASNLGRIKSLRRKTAKILKPTESKVRKKKGYFNVEILGKTQNIHKLIAEAFIPNPNNFNQINHIDGDKHNNKAENLEWCTNKENHSKAGKMGLKARGERQGLSKLTDADVYTIKLTYPQMSLSQLAKKFNVSKSTIWYIVSGKTWKHIIIY